MDFDFYIVLQIISVVFGALFGMGIADIDHNLWFLKHRSMFTHGILPPLALVSVVLFGQSFLGYVFVGAVSKAIGTYAIYFTGGFCATYAIHLVFDMFPKQWVGIALIHTPFGRMWPSVSWLWMSIGLMFSLYTMLVFLPDEKQRVLLGVAMVGLFIKSKVKERKEGNHILLPGITLCLAGWLSYILVNKWG